MSNTILASLIAGGVAAMTSLPTNFGAERFCGLGPTTSLPLPSGHDCPVVSKAAVRPCRTEFPSAV